MVFEIHTRGFTLTNALENVIEMRAQAITASWRSQLTRIDITLSDANGPTKGGIDKICKVRCHLAGNDTLFAESTALDMYEAIHACFDKIKRRINKQRKRLLSRKHRRGLQAAAPRANDLDALAYEPYEQNYLLGRATAHPTQAAQRRDAG